jgi:hypothetical protein
MQEIKTLSLRLLALTAGLAYLTVIYRFPSVGHHDLIAHLVLSFLVLGPVTVALVVYSGKGSWIAVPLLVLLGVVFGIMIDVVLDTKVDRNIFPVEIVFWCVFLAPVMIVSSALGWFLRNRVYEGDSLTDREFRSQGEARSVGISASANDVGSSIKLWTTRLLAAVAGAMYVIVSNQIAGLPYLSRFPLLFVVLVFAILFLITLVITAFSKHEMVRFANHFFLVGVAAGVVVLFISVPEMYLGFVPTKIAVWCLMLAPAVASGSALGAWLRKNRQIRTDAKPLNSPARS